MHAVKPGNLIVNDVASGVLESSRNNDAFCLVEGTMSIISILPEGTIVKKGDLVCKLDSAALKDRLADQRIAVEAAEAAYQNAKRAREVAELALAEYVEGISKQERANAKGEIESAQAAVRKGEGRLDRTRRARNRINDATVADRAASPPADILAELDILDRLDVVEQNLEREKTLLARASAKLDMLERFTWSKTTKELDSEVKKARSDELAKKATWDLELSKQEKLEGQLAAYFIKAPSNGVIVCANDPSPLTESSRIQIEERARERERQRIFSIPDMSKMRVNTKVGEPRVDQIQPA